ncbi:complex I NDUFA9 subunit family protein [Chelativorans sp. Marseille-P2723]|uniref:complex I NDUFA9 subunit family protein n=1 Tax=Chelativorans sp. Marseille-P2723 TaxID=2709133 RepID=UPI0015708D3F|nr:complex I NDUFA9 subunit family protein [Chelativorans sp. Marseille-P2723]
MAIIRENPSLVTVFGGSGFVGRYVVQALTRRGYRVRVACRNPHTAVHVLPLGNMGQVHLVQANLRYRWSVDRAVEGADHVINLVGILHENGKQRFDAVHRDGARAVAEAAREAGAGLTQGSAIGADVNSPSLYGRSKAEGERAALEAMQGAVIIRPSIIFGPEDSFFNRFANMARFSPFLPLIGGGHTKFQPVYVGDVAEVYARSVDGTLAPGGIYELGGPQILTFRECMEEMLEIIGRKRPLVSIPWPAARMMARVLGLLPKPLLTSDQVRQLQTDNIVSEEAKARGHTLEGLGIASRSIHAILSTYLWTYRSSGQFTQPQI